MGVLFNLIMLTSIWVIGLTIITQKKMGLYVIRYALTDEDGVATKAIYDPLIICHWCMPSMHSLIGYVFAYGLGLIDNVYWWRLLIMYPLVVCGSSLLCGLTWELYLFMNSLRQQSETIIDYQKPE